MLVIDTRITSPEEEFLKAEEAKGNSVQHLPALAFSPTGIPVDLTRFDAAFVGSSRAADIAGNILLQFKGLVFSAGEKTAKSLERMGCRVAFVGSGKGAESDLSECAKKWHFQKLAWISAKETAADRGNISIKLSIEIVHFPVYETVATTPDEKMMESLPHPRKWLFFSGKAVKAFSRFLSPGDRVELHGASAARAGAALLDSEVLEK